MTCVYCSEPMTGYKRKYCDKTCRNRAFNAARKADGRLDALAAQRKTPAGRTQANAWQNANKHRYLLTKVCPCGVEFQCTANCPNQVHCSKSCAGQFRVGFCRLPVVHNRVWHQGCCSWCGSQYTDIYPSDYCSQRCKANASWHRKSKRRGEFTISRANRLAIYERDGWTCQLCGITVDATLKMPSHYAATLDHIIPQSHQLVPDHSASNLRLAHMICNAIRGDRVA